MVLLSNIQYLVKYVIKLLYRRYIRVIGTMNTHNRSFHLVAFECLYSTKPFTLSPQYEGLIGRLIPLLLPYYVAYYVE